MDNWRYHLISVLLAVLCLSGVMWVGSFAADRIFTPANLQRFQVIQQLFSTDQVGILQVLEKAGGWDVARKYAAALTDATINFEFIPYNEGKNLSALIEAIPDGVVIQSFSFEQRDLKILCQAPDLETLRLFQTQLQDAQVYQEIDLLWSELSDGSYQGTLLCTAKYKASQEPTT